MKKIDFKIVLILLLIGVVIFQLVKKPKTIEVEKIVEVEKEVIVTDTLEVEVPYEVINEVYYEKIKEVEKLVTVRDTIKIDKPIEVIKMVYVDKPIQTILEVPQPLENKLFLGFAYQFDRENYFSGSDVRLLYKFKNDKMFGLDLGIRNTLLDRETNISRLSPYVGASIYFRLDK
jgi:uncharacterized membrane protein